MKQEITVEEGYHISLGFFYELWPLVEPHVQHSEEIKNVNVLYFCIVCSGDEASTEWKQAVFRAKKIPNEKLRQAKLSEDDLFSCAIEFCKLHNERWEGNLDYTLQLLESMKANPEKHPKVWQLWKRTIEEVLVKHMTCGHFNY